MTRNHTVFRSRNKASGRLKNAATAFSDGLCGNPPTLTIQSVPCFFRRPYLYYFAEKADKKSVLPEIRYFAADGRANKGRETVFYQILALLIWSSSFIAAKFAYTMLDAALMVQARLLISVLIVLPVCRRYLDKIPKDKWKPLLWLSFLNYVAVLMLQFIGLKYTSAASAETVIGLDPLLMVFIGHFFFRDKAEWYHWLCGLTAFAGVVIMIAGGHSGGNIGFWGCLMIVAGSAVFCSITRPTQNLIADIGAPAYTSLSLAVSAVMCLPFSLLLAESYQINWSWSGGIALLYLGICCSWFGYWLWNKGMSRVPANLSGLLLTLEPVFGILMAVIVLDEYISTVSGLGMMIVVASAFAAVVLPKVLPKRPENGKAA